MALCLACTEEVGHPPVARIDVFVGSMHTSYIPLNDNFQTPVTLKGDMSADEVDDPGATRPLKYQWSIDAQYQVQDGDVNSVDITILLKGDRPVPVTLAVTDSDDHLTARSTVMIGVTIPQP